MSRTAASRPGPWGRHPPQEQPHAGRVAWFVTFSSKLGQRCQLKAKIQPKLLVPQAVCTLVPGCQKRGRLFEMRWLRAVSFLQSAQGHGVPHHCLWPSAPILSQYLGMPVLANIHLSKGAGIPNTDNLHGEIAEEVYDLQGPWAQAEDKDEGRDDGTQQFLQDEHLEGRGLRSQESWRDPSPHQRAISRSLTGPNSQLHSLPCTGRAGQTRPGSASGGHYPASGQACSECARGSRGAAAQGRTPCAGPG